MLKHKSLTIFDTDDKTVRVKVRLDDQEDWLFREEGDPTDESVEITLRLPRDDSASISKIRSRVLDKAIGLLRESLQGPK